MSKNAKIGFTLSTWPSLCPNSSIVPLLYISKNQEANTFPSGIQLIMFSKISMCHVTYLIGRFSPGYCKWFGIYRFALAWKILDFFFGFSRWRRSTWSLVQNLRIFRQLFQIIAFTRLNYHIDLRNYFQEKSSGVKDLDSRWVSGLK